jgi:hypothetical protein
MYILLSPFTSSPTSLLISISFCVFPYSYLSYLTADSYHQHKPEADVPHSISVPPGFPGSYRHIATPVAIKHFLVVDQSGLENYQTNVYIQTLMHVSLKHIFIVLISFKAAPNIMQLSYNTFLLNESHVFLNSVNT